MPDARPHWCAKIFWEPNFCWPFLAIWTILYLKKSHFVDLFNNFSNFPTFLACLTIFLTFHHTFAPNVCQNFWQSSICAKHPLKFLPQRQICAEHVDESVFFPVGCTGEWTSCHNSSLGNCHPLGRTPSCADALNSVHCCAKFLSISVLNLCTRNWVMAWSIPCSFISFSA